jgi:hypothetical protein
MKVKRANRLISIIDEIWVIHLQKVNTLLMIGIYDKYFHFRPEVRLPIVQFVDDARTLINGGNFHRFNILNQYL